MNKQEFLSGLRNALSGLPQDDIEERLSFYSEMIDDRVEEGMTEEEAVASIGSINDVVSQILSDVPITKLIKERIKPKRSLGGLEIALLILGFPLWFPLLIAAASLIFAFYAVIWSLIISLWAIELSFIACGFAGIAAGAAYAVNGLGVQSLATFGIGIFFCGFSVFTFFCCKAATKGMLKLTKKALLGIKSLFVRKENKKGKKDL